MTSRIVLLPALLLTTATLASAAPAGHNEGYVPVAAKVTGKFNSSWTTDLWIYRESATTINLWYNPSGHDNSNGLSVAVPLTQPVTYLADVVGTLFARPGTKGSIHYLADGQVIVVSRTWTPGKTGGTYGQIAEGLPVSLASPAGAGPGGSLRMMLNQASGFRANLGLINVTGATTTATVEVFTADGQPAPGTSTLTATLQPYDMRQLDDILAGLTPGTRQGLIVRVSVSQGDGALLAYLSEVDDTTNSGSYQEGFRFGY
jgi:hypothetical protein